MFKIAKEGVVLLSFKMQEITILRTWMSNFFRGSMPLEPPRIVLFWGKFILTLSPLNPGSVPGPAFKSGGN